MYFGRKIVPIALLVLLAGCASTGFDCPGEVCRSDHQEIKGEVSFNGGTAGYSIPIELPDSPAWNPAVSVNYSSRGGNGEMGEGWSNAASSSIFRCPATRAMDGYSSGERFAPDDRLCLDGQHLVVTRGTYGVSGTTYTTEIEHNVSVEQSGELNAKGTYFTAYYRNGVEVLFDTPATPVGAPAPLVWNATRMEDSEHQVLSYHYVTPEPGEMLISEIRYGGHDDAGEIHEGDGVIRYHYEVRPDDYTGYIAGGATPQSRRVDSIETGLDTHTRDAGLAKLRTYSFGYEPSLTSGRSLLTSVTECRREDGGQFRCHLPTRIEWPQRALHFADPYRYATRDSSQDEDVAFAPEGVPAPRPPYARGYDYDGDGRVEVLEAKPGRPAHLYFLDLGGGLDHDVDLGGVFPQDGSRWDQGQGDFVNLGVGALVGDAGGKLAARYWDGQTFAAPDMTDVPYARARLTGSFKGAGQTDVMQIEPGTHGGGVVRYYENEGSVSGHLRFRAAVDVLTLPAVEGYQLEQHGTDWQGNGCADALVTHDGRIVYIVLASDALDGVHFQVVTPADYGIPEPLQGLQLYYLDLNADGLTDVVYTAADGTARATWHYLLNTGKGFAAAVDTGVPDARASDVAVAGTLTGDLANDGTEEILYPAARLVDFCITVAGQDAPWCSGDKLAGHYAGYDLGIYRYAVLRFVGDTEGRYRPVLLPDANIVAQANLASAMDIRGDGLTSVLSPFDPWFSNGAFRQADGKLSRCPPAYGCGLHISINASGAHADQRDAAPDMATKIDAGKGDWVAWHYYPISNPVRAAYSVPPPASPERYLGPSLFYFTSSMYVAADETMHSADGSESHARFDFGGAQYDGDGRGFQGFQWIVYHNLDMNSREVWIYRDGFPWDGANLSHWTEAESAQGDDYLKGTPGPDYVDYTHSTYDCLGPSAGCGRSSDGSYQVRERSRIEVRQDPVTHEVTSTEKHFYVYDCAGRRHEVTSDDADASLYPCDSR